MPHAPIGTAAETAGPDPVARRIRELRTAQGVTLRDLAAHAAALLAPRPAGQTRHRIPSVSASYVSLIETGRKVPDEAVAVALAMALGDDDALYRAWVRARKRTDLDAALAAAETLKRLLAAAPGRAPRPAAAARGDADDLPPPAARIRVPVIAEGADPGPALRPACDVLEWRALELARLPAVARARVNRPVAWRVTPAGARRVRGLVRPLDHVLLLRDFLPLSRDDVHAVRCGGRVEIGRVLWNGRQLLLLSGDGESDFVVLEADGEPGLRSLILGSIMTVELDPPGGRR